LILLDENPDEIQYECVKKQPCHIGFARTVFAIARRRLQARICKQRADIQSLAHRRRGLVDGKDMLAG
jgi:hypothetical protein